MSNMIKVAREGVIDEMPESIWNQLPSDKSGWSLAVVVPEEVVKPKVKKEPVVVPEEGVAYPTDSAPNADWTVGQLRKYASDNSISLGRTRTEDKILEKIRKAGH